MDPFLIQFLTNRRRQSFLCARIVCSRDNGDNFHYSFFFCCLSGDIPLAFLLVPCGGVDLWNQTYFASSGEAQKMQKEPTIKDYRNKTICEEKPVALFECYALCCVLHVWACGIDNPFFVCGTLWYLSAVLLSSSFTFFLLFRFAPKTINL